MFAQIRAREGARMLLDNDLLRRTGTGCQFLEFVRQVGLGREQGRAVRGAVADVHLALHSD